jgi:hypothetical protein
MRHGSLLANLVGRNEVILQSSFVELLPKVLIEDFRNTIQKLYNAQRGDVSGSNRKEK